MNKQIRSSLLSIFLAAVMLITAICPAAAVWADTPADDNESGMMDYEINIKKQNYTHNASPITSYLVPLQGENGGLMSVQYGEAGTNKEYRAVLVRYYTDNLQPDADREPRAIPLKLPIFGGFYAADQYYFVLSGRNNPNEHKDRAEYMITKYDHTWKELDSAVLENSNTIAPFSVGTARMAASGDYLMIRTCHKMYKTYDGKNHQANVTIQLNMETMEITDAFTRIGSGSGYVSHSFNQFVQTEDDQMIAVDHGDAYPRAVVLAKYNNKLSSGKFGGGKTVNVLNIKGARGAYATNASVGGFEISDSAYLIAGNSIDQDPASSSKARNVFVAAVNKDLGNVNINWLTNDTEESSWTTPHLVKNGDKDEYLVLWQDDKTDEIYCKKIDGSGSIIGDSEILPIAASPDPDQPAGKISDCVPVIVSGGSLMAFTASNGDKTTLCGIDTASLSAVQLITDMSSPTYPVSEPLPDYLLAADEIDNDDSLGSGSVIDPPSSNGSGSGSSYISNEFSITFNANGGCIYGNSVLLTSSWRLPYLPSVSRDGYIFEGWYTALTGGMQIDASTQFQANCQLFAHWKEDPQREYTITFDANGGTASGSTVRSTVQKKLTDLPAAEKDGFIFQGWYTADGNRITETYQFTADITLFAQWQQKPAEYTVTFDANGGTVTGDSSMTTVDQKLPDLPEAVRKSYTWNGWYSSPSGGTQISASQVFQADTTLYAQWTAEPSTKVTVKKITLQSVKSPAKGRLKATWKRYSAAGGYQIAYSKSKSFPSEKTAVKNVSASKQSKAFSVMSKGKTYYVRVRAYRKVNGKKYYGSWSNVKKVKVKK